MVITTLKVIQGNRFCCHLKARMPLPVLVNNTSLHHILHHFYVIVDYWRHFCF